MPKTKTHEQYCKELRDIGSTLIPIEQYAGARTKIKHLCIVHNIPKSVSPTNALRGGGCDKCHYERVSSSLLISHEEYCKRLSEMESPIVPLEHYKGNKINISHKCTIHNVVWKTSPGSILQGAGCEMCMSEKLNQSQCKTQQQYEQDLLTNNPTIICIDKYINNHTKIKHKCLLCGHEWDVLPSNVGYGRTGCPICNISKGENIIKDYLDTNNIEYIPQKRFEDCRDTNTLPFDFYLPTLNKMIEFDGRQHSEADDFFGGEDGLKYTQLHDEIKNKYCQKNNIPLLRIPYYEEDIETQLNNFIFN